ncbi:MAG TPA: hypothetical protein VKP60_21900 [Magnetospirillaceae bacterium]|nr:hypothetical protein [Magnetospirillaceae bacterium]
MTEKRGGVTHRGLLWAGGLAAIPLAPAGAFLYQAGGLPWELDTADTPRPDGEDRDLLSVPLDPTGLLGRGNPFKTDRRTIKRN